MSANALTLAIASFAGLAAAIALIGVYTAGVGDRLADRTGLGEAIIGAVFIGATTSLPGSIASILAAASGHPSLAVANGLGGIAAQTAFLAVADITYRRINLEHAAASVENLTQGALLVVLLAMVVLTVAAPPSTIFGVNPASLALVVAYGFGIHLVAKARASPMWRPRKTRETRTDEPDPRHDDGTPVRRTWLAFATLAALLAAAGFGIARSAVTIVEHSGLSETVVGAIFLAVATSLPELVIALGAVRRGALTLAVSNILGGNCFDVLFLALSDAAYRGGSIYHAITDQDRFVVALTLLLGGILLLGLLRRQKHGFANIGFESGLVLVVYLGGMLMMVRL